MSAKVYCVSCQRVVRSVILAALPRPKCLSCYTKSFMLPEQWRHLKREGVFSVSPDGRVQ